ncbi:hypothetical protein Z043_116950, partial [Scleropages formosus]
FCCHRVTPTQGLAGEYKEGAWQRRREGCCRPRREPSQRPEDDTSRRGSLDSSCKLIKKEGSGTELPMTGDKVYIHYTGTLLDGTEFESSRGREMKFCFELGKGEVIKAWDLGVATMKAEEVSRFICKPEYAYGQSGSPPKVPPSATLVFEVWPHSSI